MNIKDEHTEAINMLQTVCETPRAKAVLDFAVKRGLEKAVVTCPDGSEHAASMYAWQLYCNIDRLTTLAPEDAETCQVVLIMSALEESASDTWSYGTKLLYDMRKAGIGPNHREFGLFLAMEGGWDNPEKNTLLEADRLALYFHAGKLMTLCGTLPGMPSCFQGTGTPLELPAPLEQPAATIQQLAMRYIPACVGQDNATKVAGVLKMLAYRSNFYTAVSSSGFEEGSLAYHTIDVIYALAQITKPLTEEQMGICVLAGLGHDLAEAEFFNKDGEGKMVRNPMPFGHGRKSVYLLGGYLGDCMPKSVACAIDVHMNDTAGNPYSHLQMMEEPLGLYLHIADILAVYEMARN